MPTNISLDNNFIAGLKTEYTGLNFPENAATDTDNCVYSLIGDVLRREGIDFEANARIQPIDGSSQAISTYKWNNAGGDGLTQVVVLQIGNIVYFFTSTNATVANPLSAQLQGTGVTLSTFIPAGSPNNAGTVATIECQYADGNGFLFIFHPQIEPLYCTLISGVVTAHAIPVQTRDLAGIPEAGVADNYRPLSLTNEHSYNLTNQGWGKNLIVTSTTTNTLQVGSATWTLSPTVSSTLFKLGDRVGIQIVGGGAEHGVITAFNGTTITVNVTVVNSGSGSGSNWQISYDPNYLFPWNATIGNWPSNSDQWFAFRNSSNTFDPGTTIDQVPLGQGPAPKGFFVTPSVFNQDRVTMSGITGLTAINTFVRPRTGCWFAGRVWYGGVDATQFATGDAPDYSWTESIYFSQIVTNPSQFGKCYQVNDPTNDILFALLPTDGGTITIPGTGAIYKLFPLQNGILVFASNGIWFITGGQSIGFTATDYTITKISAVRAISGTSFIDVNGTPFFWNEEGIYAVVASQSGAAPLGGEHGALTVENLCLGTILSFYNEIPLISKKYARGDYNPITFVLQWAYRSTNEAGISNRYHFDSILNFNTSHKAFYPHSLAGTPFISDIRYVASPGGTSAPDPIFKYVTFASFGGVTRMTFSEERDNVNWVDWKSFDGVGVNYESFFITGFKLSGKGVAKWNPSYIYVFSRNNENNAYNLQSIWDFAIDPNSGRISTIQRVVNSNTSNRFGMVYRRHKLRGHGLAGQIKVSSFDGQPFDIMGWTLYEDINAGV